MKEKRRFSSEYFRDVACFVCLVTWGVGFWKGEVKKFVFLWGVQNIIGNGQDHLVGVFNSQCILFDSI